MNWYDLNMYIINVIADDETKIGLYEIYFFKWLKLCYGDEKINYEKLQFEREIIDVVRSSYI
jgi:hypothetical protein